METLAAHACFGGTQSFHRHDSGSCAGPMRFGVYVPPHAAGARLPVVLALAGLTCTEETFAIKAGAQEAASRLGLILVTPDTSPRGPDLPGDSESWDFGRGAGFYVDATQAPWRSHYRMFTYITDELPALIDANFPADARRWGVMGHSMGGHGALVAAMRRPDRFKSCSAFAPISAPTKCPWGQKAFAGYLGPEETKWAAYDASALILARPFAGEILVDQGLADKFLAEQLMPERLEQAAASSGQKLRLRRHEGYDHGYFFIQSFAGEHLAHHARALG